MKYARAAFGLIGGLGLAATMPALAAVTSPSDQHTMEPMPQHVSSMPPQHSVALLQESLDSTGANLRVDGIWGAKTEAALRRYQRQHGLQITGHVDTTTRRMLAPIG